MSLIGTLNVAKSGLAVQQAALQVTGNNISNAANPDYTRQVSITQPNVDQQIGTGIFMGTGINLTGIQRQVDEALNARVQTATSDQAGSDVTSQWISQIESVFNPLASDSLSSRLGQFFSSWQQLASNPQDMGLRQVVIQNGQSVCTWMQTTRNDLSNLQKSADDQLKNMASDADKLAQQIADLNGQIVVTEGGSGGTANGLRDQRDTAVTALSKLMNVTTVTGSDGVMNVYVGSEPLVYNTLNRGVALQQTNNGGTLSSDLVFKKGGGSIGVTSGQLGALEKIRTTTTQDAIDQLDTFSGQLIYQVNKIHASGQGTSGMTSVLSTNEASDVNAPLDSSATGLKFPANNGSFVVHIRNKTTGVTSSEMVNVALNGTNSGMSLAMLQAKLNAIPGLSAQLIGGKLQVTSQGDSEISFSQDSSGVLASLGVNTFFSGSSGLDMKVNDVVAQSPSLLAAAQNGNVGDNQTALQISQLSTQSMSTLGGASLDQYLQGMMNTLGVQSSDAKTTATAAQNVLDTLNAQRQAVSGVSMDEETVNLMLQQRAYQGSARLISVVDELMQTVINMK